MHINPFSQRLRALMKRDRVTQQQLADAMEVSRAAVNKWLSGSVPRMGVIRKMAEFFKCEQHELFRGFPPAPASIVSAAKVANDPDNIPADEYESAMVEAQYPDKKEAAAVRHSMRLVTRRTEAGLEWWWEPKPPEEKDIDRLRYCVNSEGMSNMEILLARVRRAVKTRGKKGELAKFLGVPPPRVSEWLSGSPEPGGEYTLRLLQWVEQQERQ